MTDAADPGRFFARYARFVDSSETGPWEERLDARHRALIDANRDLLAGARVLDLAGHDGRFGFAALHAGADHLVSIDVKAHLAATGRSHLEAYGIDPSRYEFFVGDMYDYLDRGRTFDVVFAFGILYHVNDHMGLLDRVFAAEPTALVIDTNVSLHDGAIVEVRSPLGASPPPPGADIEGYPTVAAIDAWCASFGWSVEWFDWASSGLCEREHMADYREGRRGDRRGALPGTGGRALEAGGGGVRDPRRRRGARGGDDRHHHGGRQARHCSWCPAGVGASCAAARGTGGRLCPLRSPDATATEVPATSACTSTSSSTSVATTGPSTSTT